MTVEYEITFRDMFMRRRRERQDTIKAKALEAERNEPQSSNFAIKRRRLCQPLDFCSPPAVTEPKSYDSSLILKAQQ